jgi:hypothetical protein
LVGLNRLIGLPLVDAGPGPTFQPVSNLFNPERPER